MCDISSAVFQEWLECGDKRNRDMIERLEEQALELELEVVFGEYEVKTIYVVRTEGEVLRMTGYDMFEFYDSVERGEIVDRNYEIYLLLMARVYGLEPFKEFNRMISYKKYLEEVKDRMKEHPEEFSDYSIPCRL